MKTHSKSSVAVLGAGIVAAGVLPLILYWPAFSPPGIPEPVPVRDIRLFEQWLVVLTAFVVKPAYMALSAAWIVWLWRRDTSDLVALRWGLIFFLGGEIACAANYLLFSGRSAVTDYLHSYGMTVGFAFVAYAVLEGMDLRLIKYSAAKDRCAALSLCRSCIKYADVPCGLRRLFSFLIPALVVVALMLPCAELQPATHRTHVLGSVQEFSSPTWAQLYEARYCAWAAVLLMLVSWAMLSFRRNDPVAAAKLFFAAALGPLGFGLMRLFLRAAYRENLAWANIWEEVTELIFVVGVGVVIWLFRGSLFRPEPVTAADQPDATEAAA